MCYHGRKLRDILKIVRCNSQVIYTKTIENSYLCTNNSRKPLIKINYLDALVESLKPSNSEENSPTVILQLEYSASEPVCQYNN